MKFLRYPLLFLAIILIPTWLTTSTGHLVGYFLGYLLIYIAIQLINNIRNKEIYPKRIRTTYLVTNSLVALLLWGVLSRSIALLYAGQSLNPNEAVIFIGLPWVSVQMLLLLFFVQSDNVLK